MSELTDAIIAAQKYQDFLRSTCVYVLGYLEGKPNRSPEEEQILARVKVAVFHDEPVKPKP